MVLLAALMDSGSGGGHFADAGRVIVESRFETFHDAFKILRIRAGDSVGAQFADPVIETPLARERRKEATHKRVRQREFRIHGRLQSSAYPVSKTVELKIHKVDTVATGVNRNNSEKISAIAFFLPHSPVFTNSLEHGLSGGMQPPFFLFAEMLED